MLLNVQSERYRLWRDYIYKNLQGIWKWDKEFKIKFLTVLNVIGNS